MTSHHPLPASDKARHDRLGEEVEREHGIGDDDPEARRHDQPEEGPADPSAADADHRPDSVQDGAPGTGWPPGEGPHDG